ncbi:hypothetical protein MPTK1_4g06930 [Marchantia polymorpha subsp. ruderalis]|uniref:Protein PEP-RELATED DEVELOPMENT ARRESTED 1, chloroplastic n=2 Tax=Marchantia polymorpha TaxID=3197 RepID=A0AAF6B789_MARPO|nr:hypothetical protein MARPO_0125s0038 [Marchantia polymorpha]BBN07873.1 hypothetical protein Mp_4g06930 [Marchantia polymorpha subsp. ruderalis]|eukprot:PTQ30407.1 hypothetical protein MARPO_0125s0038 [Marchantia polymorpha]
MGGYCLAAATAARATSMRASPVSCTCSANLKKSSLNGLDFIRLPKCQTIATSAKLGSTSVVEMFKSATMKSQQVLRRFEAKAVFSEAKEGGEKKEKVDYKLYQALMRGGEEVIAMMKEMTELLEDIAGMEKEEEEAAVRMAAAGAVGQKLEKLEGSFLMALDWMIEQSEREKDDKKVRLLGIIKETVLAQLSHQFPSQVQVVGTLCTTPDKDARQEILRRCAGGGGTFKTVGGGDIVLPEANLNEIANQADDIVTSMEEKPLLQDRRLLAKLILVREEARSLLSGGILDERNDNKGFKNLPFTEVTFLSTLMGLRPGPLLRLRIENVMRGKDEGQEKAPPPTKESITPRQKFVNFDKKSKAGSDEEDTEPRPVRPGIFLYTVNKVMAGMYETNVAGGVTVQQLEWIHKETLNILQEIAYSTH